MEMLVSMLAVLAVALLGLVAGVFFAFSVSVLPALNRVPASSAVTGMRSINRVIQNPVFFAVFFGAALVPLLAATGFLLQGAHLPGLALAAAGAIYLLGAFAPTVVVNVPLNNALEAAGEPADSHAAVEYWAAFAPRWHRWNTVRAASSTLSLVVGLCGIVWAG